ncbi:predicted GPI-anchored protein 58 [Panicum virgatum]|uniref:predicted GPI-anchored protein 58 n=1 Tax=Panicum virgatum TaxID=38727 RepID=UPI0019D53D8E|nr:predicted GPI-anchored protein 58 [Panicum virgatum]
MVQGRLVKQKLTFDQLLNKQPSPTGQQATSPPRPRHQPTRLLTLAPQLQDPGGPAPAPHAHSTTPRPQCPAAASTPQGDAQLAPRHCPAPGATGRLPPNSPPGCALRLRRREARAAAGVGLRPRRWRGAQEQASAAVSGTPAQEQAADASSGRRRLGAPTLRDTRGGIQTAPPPATERPSVQEQPCRPPSSRRRGPFSPASLPAMQSPGDPSFLKS